MEEFLLSFNVRTGRAPLYLFLGKTIEIPLLITKTGYRLKKSGPSGLYRETLMVEHDVDDDEKLFNHMWIDRTNALGSIRLDVGDSFLAQGKVRLYERGDGSKDFQLVNVKRI